MSEKEKQVAESLRKNTSGLSAEQMQRLGDIAYGMLLTKELAQPEKKEGSACSGLVRLRIGLA